jgi:WD40 repeat protein
VCAMMVNTLSVGLMIGQLGCGMQQQVNVSLHYKVSKESKIYIYIYIYISPYVLLGHTDLVRTLNFDQERIVSASYDQSIRVWDLK